MKKSGRNLGDIFTSTASKMVGQTITSHVMDETPAVVKTTIFFTQDQLDYLDEQTRGIRKASKKTLKRTALLRAVVQALADLQVDLSACSTEAALTQGIKKCMPIKGGKYKLTV